MAIKKNTKTWFAPNARVAFLKVNLMLVGAFFIALLIVAFAGSQIANGFGAGDKPETYMDVSASSQVSFDNANSGESDVLKNASKRDVSGLVKEIADEQEAARIKAEEEKRKHDIECAERARQAKLAQHKLNDGVDFTIGKDAFVDTWGARIDAYLAGSPLSGKGRAFAEAAFEYGVDPRWSPAISNTESTKGRNCFQSHNAWGWMGSSWSNWDDAIWAHVKGLATGYGYTISLQAAMKYCPPTYESWYEKTINQMNLI